MGATWLITVIVYANAQSKELREMEQQLKVFRSRAFQVLCGSQKETVANPATVLSGINEPHQTPRTQVTSRISSKLNVYE